MTEEELRRKVAQEQKTDGGWYCSGCRCTVSAIDVGDFDALGVGNFEIHTVCNEPLRKDGPRYTTSLAENQCLREQLDQAQRVAYLNYLRKRLQKQHKRHISDFDLLCATALDYCAAYAVAVKLVTEDEVN